VTRVDFYILQDVDASAAWRFACRLAVKAVGSGNCVHIHAEAAVAAEVDELLWHYPEHRFIPHGCERPAGADGSPVEAVARERSSDTPAHAPLPAPVVIGWSIPANADGVLINLAGEIPSFFGRFERVAEIIVGANRDAGRDRYKFYRDRGYPLFHHDLDDWEAA
jgi:DNA polymerase III subunit chi